MYIYWFVYICVYICISVCLQNVAELVSTMNSLTLHKYIFSFVILFYKVYDVCFSCLCGKLFSTLTVSLLCMFCKHLSVLCFHRERGKLVSMVTTVM